MTHLGDRLTALVDGELGHSARERALAHLAVCEECRAHAEAQRRLKARLNELPGPDPSMDLVRRLCELAGPGAPLPPERRPLPGTGPPGGRPPVARMMRRPGTPPRKRRLGPLRYAAASALSLVVLALTMAFLAGGDDDPDEARVAPPVNRYVVEHATTAGGIPLSDPASGAAATVSRPDKP